MLHLFQALSRLLANYTSIFVIGVAVFTFFFPHTFDWVRGITQTVILGIIMLTMGLTLTTNDFKILAQRPLDVFIGACAQFIIMPGVAYLLVHVWHLDPALALGILLVTIIPVAIGCTLNYIYGKRECFPTIQSLMPGISVTCLAIIVGGVISTVHDDLVARGMMLFLWTFAVVFCHNTLGYCLGWLAGKLAGFNTAKKRTISIEVGMQNAGLATVLAGNFFAAQPLAVLPCAISCAWHSISGTILAGIYLKWDKMHGKN